MGKIWEITHKLHQKRHGLASPRLLVLLHACKWVDKSYKKLYCIEIITQACLLRCKITHIDYSHHWYIRRLQSGHIFMMRYAKSHTDRSFLQVDLARRSSILLAFGLFFMTRYAPHFGFSSCLQVSTSERYRQGGNKYLKIPSPIGGKAKGSHSVTEKLQQAFHRLVLPNARRFWATFPWHSYKQGVYHKDFSSSCARGMRNPITHITRIRLAIERSRRRKKREKQKLAPYKIYSLYHS
jgi:hypothetical protein